MTDQDTTATQTQAANADKEHLPEPYEKTTRHSITLDGREWRYDATLGTIDIDTAKVKPAASIFFAAFNAVDDQGAVDPSRPVTFIFNGGPGSSSTFLLLGSIAPKRIDVTDTDPVPAAPYTLADNPETLLPVSDLVFIDAAGASLDHPGQGQARTVERGRRRQGLQRVHPSLPEQIPPLELAQVRARRILWHHPWRRALVPSPAGRRVPERSGAHLEHPRLCACVRHQRPMLRRLFPDLRLGGALPRQGRPGSHARGASGAGACLRRRSAAPGARRRRPSGRCIEAPGGGTVRRTDRPGRRLRIRLRSAGARHPVPQASAARAEPDRGTVRRPRRRLRPRSGQRRRDLRGRRRLPRSRVFQPGQRLSA